MWTSRRELAEKNAEVREGTCVDAGQTGGLLSHVWKATRVLFKTTFVSLNNFPPARLTRATSLRLQNFRSWNHRPLPRQTSIHHGLPTSARKRESWRCSCHKSCYSGIDISLHKRHMGLQAEWYTRLEVHLEEHASDHYPSICQR